MADIFTIRKRSEIMARVSGKETKFEILVRKYLFAHKFRYRKNVKTLPGKPDILLPKYKTAIFIHGCFWHGHDCKKAALPSSNVNFWSKKINGNKLRDKRNKSELRKLGWCVIEIWECKLNNKQAFEKTMVKLIKKIKQTIYNI